MTDTLEQPAAAADAPAARLAAAWKLVRRAACTDYARPILQAICLDNYPTGVRVVATNSYEILHCWAGGVEDPGLDADPTASVLVDDVDGIAYRFVRSIARRDCTAGVAINPEDGMVRFSHGAAAITVSRTAGEYPNWRKMYQLTRNEGGMKFVAPDPTEGIRLSPERLRILSHPRASIGPKLTFCGADGPVIAEWTDLDMPLRGLVMPITESR